MTQPATLSGVTAMLSALVAAASIHAAVPQPSPATSATKVTPMTPDVVASYDSVRPEADYVKRVEMVPMRDGVKLYTVIVFKKGTSGAPILLSRTPYDAKSMTARTKSQSITEILPAMDAEVV